LGKIGITIDTAFSQRLIRCVYLHCVTKHKFKDEDMATMQK
jgi:hypothetical protein